MSGKRRGRVETALRERDSELRSLADNIPDGAIYQIVRRPDGSTYFPYVSMGLARMLELAPDRRPRDADELYRLLPAPDAERVRAAEDESMRAGTPFDVECRIGGPNGTWRWLNLRGRPRRLADGATLWDAVALDISARKRAEEATVLRSVAALARAVAHEINNPLAVIMGTLELMDAGKHVADATSRTRAAAQRIREVVCSMQHLARVESAAQWPADVPSMLDLRRSGGDGR